MARVVWSGIHFRAYHEDVEVRPGTIRTFEYVWRIDGTRSVVVNDAGEILLTREYRHELEDFDWRLPGGKLDTIDEPIEVAAARELREETGVAASKWTHLWSTSPDATVRFRRHFLLAEGITLGDQKLDAGEDISIRWFSREDARKMALSGEMAEEISALAVLRYISQAQ